MAVMNSHEALVRHSETCDPYVVTKSRKQSRTSLEHGSYDCHVHDHVHISETCHVSESCHVSHMCDTTHWQRFVTVFVISWLLCKSRDFMNQTCHVSESCQACQWVISHIWMNHVTYMNESWTSLKHVTWLQHGEWHDSLIHPTRVVHHMTYYVQTSFVIMYRRVSFCVCDFSDLYMEHDYLIC